jgi:hypothetical protein
MTLPLETPQTSNELASECTQAFVVKQANRLSLI